MYIKIYNRSQLILLEQINPLLGKYRLPLELLTEVEKILAPISFLLLLTTPKAVYTFPTTDLSALKELTDFCYRF